MRGLSNSVYPSASTVGIHPNPIRMRRRGCRAYCQTYGFVHGYPIFISHRDAYANGLTNANRHRVALTYGVLTYTDIVQNPSVD